MGTSPQSGQASIAQTERRRGARIGLGISFALGVAIAVSFGIYKFYSDYVLPTRKINAFGVEEIRVWTAREVIHERWFDGSAATYVFAIAADTEARLRRQCTIDPAVPGAVESGTCTFARDSDVNEPEVWADVGPRTVGLHYVFN